MLLNPQYYLFATAIALLIYWGIPSRKSSIRAWAMIVLSAIVVSGVSVEALFLGIAASLTAWLASVLLRFRRSFWIVLVATGLIIGLLLLPRALPDVGADINLLTTIGIGFFCLKSISIVLDSWRLEESYRLCDVFLLNLFFPIYSAGPIEQISTINQNKFAVDFDANEFTDGVIRILFGIFKYYYVADALIGGLLSLDYSYKPGAQPVAMTSMLVICFLRWLSLYFFFSGYSDIAIGTAKLFNVKVRENFDHPYLADSIQNYWQRWHMSLMNFMSQYVYLAFVRRTGWRLIGIGLVFLTTAAWHNINWNYLMWGIAHASAMMGCYVYRRRMQQIPLMESVQRNVLYITLARILTIAFVVVISAIGTAETLSESKWIIESLLPGI